MQINLYAALIICMVTILLGGCDAGTFESEEKYETYAYEDIKKAPVSKIEIIVSYKNGEVKLRERTINVVDGTVNIGQASSKSVNDRCEYFDKKNWTCSADWRYEMRDGVLYFGRGSVNENWRMESSVGGKDWKFAEHQARAREDFRIQEITKKVEIENKQTAAKVALDSKRIADEENAFKQHVAAQERERRENEKIKNEGQLKEEVKSSIVKVKRSNNLYPVSARRAGLEGRVLLRALVDERGIATQVTVISSSGHRILDDAAVESLQTWEFYPAIRNGLTEKSWVQIPIQFELSN